MSDIVTINIIQNPVIVRANINSLVEDVTVNVSNMKGDVGPAGPPGNISDFVFDEIPSGTINGSNATFTSAYPFDSTTITIFLNGLNQLKLNDFNTSGTQTIIFYTSPQVGDTITINYLKL